MSEDYKKKYEELLKRIQESRGSDRRFSNREGMRDIPWGMNRGFPNFNNWGSEEDRKKYEELFRQRMEMMEYFLKNKRTSFPELLENRFNQLVLQDDFFWVPQQDQNRSATLSLRIDANLKQWLENLAEELGTSSSKIVERALSLLRSAKTITEADNLENNNEDSRSQFKRN